MKIIVYHGEYGCETGCCGHWVKSIDNKGVSRSKFEFSHPDEQAGAYEFAKETIEAAFGKEHCADLDWENCRIVSYQNCS